MLCGMQRKMSSAIDLSQNSMSRLQVKSSVNIILCTCIYSWQLFSNLIHIYVNVRWFQFFFNQYCAKTIQIQTSKDLYYKVWKDKMRKNCINLVYSPSDCSYHLHQTIWQKQVGVYWQSTTYIESHRPHRSPEKHSFQIIKMLSVTSYIFNYTITLGWVDHYLLFSRIEWSYIFKNFNLLHTGTHIISSKCG